jgi:hypothetical protein
MPTDADRPLDLLTVREAARLVDRGVSTLRGWVRAGELRGWHADPAHPENTPLLVSRAEVLALVVTTGRASNPGRRSPAGPTPPPTPPTDTPTDALDLARLRSTVAELRADVRVALAERDGARGALEATVREVAAVAGRCSTLEALADAERRRADDLADRLAAAEAERDALREHQGLPWWRRLLAPPSTSPKRLPGGGGDGEA